MRTLRVGLAQINTTVGDLDGNVAKILEYTGRAREQGVDLVAFPELAVSGYPPEDLLHRSRFVTDNLEALQRVVQASQGITMVVGFVDGDGEIYNAAAVIHNGQLVGVYHKQLLPNYGVFDEQRYFQPGAEAPVFEIAAVQVGVNVCEDIWYSNGPQRAQALAGAELIVNINGSPFHAGKGRQREEMLASRASENAVIVCYVNMVGGQDELVFDGGSMVFDERGELVARAAQFEEELLICDLDVGRAKQDVDGQERPVVISDAPLASEKPPISPRIAEPLEEDAEVYAALVAGTRDYVRKVGFEKVLIGLSGGIDSSIVAAIAVDALGPECVVGVAMPSRYSSEGSIADTKRLAENLGIELMVLPIETAHAAFLEMLEQPFADTKPGTAEENVQARIRGNLLMALSNKFGWLVLTTGNKSEIATGYCTLYGDMAGGFAVIKDVPKMLVYRLAEHRNRVEGRELIPREVIEKPPSAELRPDQLDTDSLPPYDELDPILQAYVEDDLALGEIVSMGHDEVLVRRVMAMVDRNEYKRRQAPPGVKITPRAFGRDRRLPIANRYRGY
ncbi:MAG: NAD+ synthase [Chloroflexi bacterium]|nr:NAD+ synthase [Chloroflexota bacterium]